MHIDVDAGSSNLPLRVNTMSGCGLMYPAQQAGQVPCCYYTTTEYWTYLGYLDQCNSPEMLNGPDCTPSVASSPSATLSIRSHNPKYQISPSAHTGRQPELLSDKEKWEGGLLDKHWESRLICCGITFACSYTLNRHRQQACKNRPKAPKLFKCDRCKGLFKRKYNLEQHLREVEHLTKEQAKREIKMKYPGRVRKGSCSRV